MFQAYYDFDKEVLVNSRDVECTINGYAQEIDLREIKKIIDEEERKNHPIKYWFKRLFKRGWFIC